MRFLAYLDPEAVQDLLFERGRSDRRVVAAAPSAIRIQPTQPKALPGHPQTGHSVDSIKLH
jgi:hypothetical protein